MPLSAKISIAGQRGCIYSRRKQVLSFEEECFLTFYESEIHILKSEQPAENGGDFSATRLTTSNSVFCPFLSYQFATLTLKMP
jgi:hypothetical protein